jgi:hypothetical protein
MVKVMYVRGKAVKPKGSPAVVETVATREPEEVNEIIQHDEPLKPQPRQLKGGSIVSLSKALNAIKLPRKKSSNIKFDI